MGRQVTGAVCLKRPGETNHVFTPKHEALIYDLGSIVAASLDMDTLLDHRIRTSS